MKSYFVNNESVVLHVLENGVASPDIPTLLIICGLWEPAERAIPLLSELPGHVIAFSFRGRGLSGTPKSGYDLEDHLSDIEAIVKHCKLQGYCLLGFSRGASYALGWSLRNQQNMRGLILVDQPPIHRSVSEEAVEFWCNYIYSQVPITNYMRLEALEGLGRDAKEVDFSSQLSQLQIPVSIFIGKNTESDSPSNISDETLQLYTSSIPSCEVVEFQRSGHMIPDDEQEKYIAEVNLFLEKIH
ncbi:alpha/beta hydrolase [Paenibacillus anaericanus]|uniref:Alpha/beta hydrolase n=1 Tax=Paenibacillus anaericanus TaxID=170367 RepID=A0A3S1DBX2_9BACL|nr:alpha/beta hydrolase [Paenibacillus anaericanus]RUT41378.1 alpha/beta hydrolase [Paenibacillus anaericanus]